MRMTGFNEDGRLRCIDQCPKCGVVGRMQCVDSRLDVTGSIRVRSKQCVNGHRYSTVEILEEDLDSLFKGEGKFNLEEVEDLLCKLSTAEVAMAQASKALSDTHKSVGAIHQEIKRRKKRESKYV